MEFFLKLSNKGFFIQIEEFEKLTWKQKLKDLWIFVQD